MCLWSVYGVFDAVCARVVCLWESGVIFLIVS